VFRIYQVSYLT